MNPENQQNLPAPERSTPLSSPESTTNQISNSGEIITPGIERGAEAKELSSEARAMASDSSAIAPAFPAQVAPSIPQPSLPVAGLTVDELEAADENEIEKEWVDKTQQIIASTKGDPFQREKQIVDVREEYQKKRFNRVRGDGQG